MKRPLLVLAGPTAVGKTAISVAVARRLGGEIISGDSMQIYRGMDIGTAKITPDETAGVPHHLLDVKNPDDNFSVAEFQELVDELIVGIGARGRLPMLVGGTGLYVRAILQEYTFTELEADHGLRARLAREEAEQGPGYLHRRLRDVDPEAAERLHPGDLRRLVRALEVFERTGVPISRTQTAAQGEARYDDLFIGLTMDRELLYHRIDARVEQMLQSGLVAEVQGLLRRYSANLPPMQAIGYREIALYLRGLLSWPEAAGLIKRNTRRFAKRQFTWFRKDSRIHWIDVTRMEPATVVEEIVRLAEGKWSRIVEPNNS